MKVGEKADIVNIKVVVCTRIFPDAWKCGEEAEIPRSASASRYTMKARERQRDRVEQIHAAFQKLGRQLLIKSEGCEGDRI